MKTVTLPALRRVYRRALLAAPLALAACRDGASPPVVIPLSTASADSSQAAADAAPPPVAASATAATRKCSADRPRVTGCGGAEVTLHDSLESCGLKADGDLPADRCAELCAGFDTRSCHVYAHSDGKPGVFCNAAHPCMGRLPANVRVGRSECGATVIDYLAFARRMEALSVGAFRDLEVDLEAWGAPVRLLRACRRAAASEARHARAMTRLLRRRGAKPERLRPARRRFDSLHALALHNESQGVVGETWGALVAAYQAEHAPDRDVRDAMRAIAREEAEHAVLSFQISLWARQTLTADDARSLDEARRAALDDLQTTHGFRPGAATAAALGWPTHAATASMLEVLAPVLEPAS